MSKKNMDSHNRLRSETIAFRVSPEEDNRINQLVALSGMTKQDYIVHRLENEELKITVTPIVYLSFKKTLEGIYSELKRIENASGVSEALEESIRFVREVLDKMNVA